MHLNWTRREFLATAAGSAAGLSVGLPIAAAQAPSGQPAARAAGGSVVIASANGLGAVARALELLRQGADPLDAAIAGVNLVEDDPNDHSVGLGGLPNEDGVVELDASVMHGPTHKAGAVAALENVRNPARVALEVLRRTDHVLLVGAGALKFARSLGFPEQDLLTDRSRQAWLRWKAALNPDDDWLDEDQRIDTGIPRTNGTIHVSAVNAAGDLGSCTSTSGLSYKLAGRVGDSPIVGAGMFVDNDVGAAGATGRGESVIKSAGAFAVVRNMAEGMEPAEACLAVLKWIAAHTKRRDLLNARGEPKFDVALYALRKDGACGAACMHEGEKFAVIDEGEARLEPCAWLY
jgi:N4-(beta-N-acetylglucosaminyl)-L-asparaginase